MLETSFVQRQRKRLLWRLTSYAMEIRNGDLPNHMRAHKAHMLREVIPTVLARIDDGCYGSCIKCGVEIPKHRLELIPDALRCVHCQSQIDQKRS
mgnify:CR=1 FL=1